MAVNFLLIKSYATNVYRTGRNTLSNIAIVRPEYIAPVMQYATDSYYIEQIDDALTEGWITPVEHAETLALKGPEDPQHRPPITFMAVGETVL
jgi:hypothetical protein